MSEIVQSPQQAAEVLRAQTRLVSASLGLRLARSVALRFGITPAMLAGEEGVSLEGEAAELLPSLRFAVNMAAAFGLPPEAACPTQYNFDVEEGQVEHALARLAQLGDAPRSLLDLVVLANLPNVHEGYATLCRLLHPNGQPYPTVTLALQWLEGEAIEAQRRETEEFDSLSLSFAMRDQIEALLVHSNIATLGMLRLEGDGPWHTRTLRTGSGLADALNCRAPQLDGAALLPGYTNVPGLDGWLSQPDVQRAVRALQNGGGCLIALLGGNEAMRNLRLRALLGAAQASGIHTVIEPGLSASVRHAKVFES